MYIYIYIILAKKTLSELIAKNNIFSKYLQEKKQRFVTTSFIFLLFKSHQII